jgi:hypothetical protein
MPHAKPTIVHIPVCPFGQRPTRSRRKFLEVPHEGFFELGPRVGERASEDRRRLALRAEEANRSS